MTPIEKAERALNEQIEESQARLKTATTEAAQRQLVQSILGWAGIGDTITEYVGAIGQYAKARHGELKQTQTALTAQHEELLKSGKEMLERLKANPSDRGIRKEIEQAQRGMEAIQKSLRRGAESLQKEVNPSIRLIDTVADSVRRLCESADKEGLRRWTKAIVGHAQELYRAHPALPSKGVIDADSWEKSATSAIDDAETFVDAQARAGFQAMIALQVMVMAVSANPPATAEEATERANTAVAQRMKKLLERLDGGKETTTS